MTYHDKPDVVTVTPIYEAAARVTLRENIRRAADGWTADEYTLDIPRLCDLEARVKRDFGAWLQMAKNKEAQENGIS